MSLKFASPLIEPHHKGFPHHAVGHRVEQLAGKLGLLRGDLPTPVLLLSESRLDRNVAAMQAFCDRSKIRFAPHVKTSMSPQVIDRQLRAGAWGVTVATPVQARTLAALGAPRILLANEVTDPTALSWLISESKAETFIYVDSLEGLRLLAEVAARAESTSPAAALIEVGYPGGRAGVRSPDTARELAQAIEQSERVRLAGVAGFEGIVGSGDDPERLDEVRSYLRDLAATTKLVGEDLERRDLLLSAGGSAFFEQVRETLLPLIGGVADALILRSGCYVTHDSGAYDRYLNLTAGPPDHPSLAASLELWSRVLSTPEPQLAILDCGKRDTAVDAGPPVPLHRARVGDSRPQVLTGATIAALNDQHAYLRHGEADLRVGDLVGCGISHPCTTFDKWRLIPVVDEELVVKDAAATLF